MIECALYGMTKQKFEWNSEKFNRTEKIYSNEKRRVCVVFENIIKTTDITEGFVNHILDNFTSAPAVNRNNSDAIKSADHVTDFKDRIAKRKNEGNVKRSYLTYRDFPDRNKQRTTVSTKVYKSAIDSDPDAFLTLLGYKLEYTNCLEGYRYMRNSYIIELTKFKKPEDMIDSSEEEQSTMPQQSLPKAIYEHYLVKVFVETEDGVEGENILNAAFEELKSKIKLVKPTLAWF
jgi:Med18 protein